MTDYEILEYRGFYGYDDTKLMDKKNPHTVFTEEEAISFARLMNSAGYSVCIQQIKIMINW